MMAGCKEKLIEMKKTEFSTHGKEENVVEGLQKGETMTEKFKETYDKIEDYLKSEDFKEKEDQVLSYFFELTDFLFYQGKINGKTFNEVSRDVQDKALELYHKLDTKLEEKYPDYKEKVKQKYGEAEDSIKEKASTLKDSLTDQLKDVLGEEKYEEYSSKVKEAKDTITETYKNFKEEHGEEIKEKAESAMKEIKEEGSKMKDKINDWYQNFKEDHTN